MYLRIVLTLAVLGAAALLVSILRMQSAESDAAPGSALRMPGEFDARLDARVAKVRLDGPFEDVIDALAKAAGVQIIVRWDSLEDAERGHRVRLSVNDIALGDAIDVIVAQLPGNGRVGFSAEQGAIVIDREHRFAGTTRFYNVRELVEQMWPPPSRRSPEPIWDGPPGGSRFGSAPPVEELMEDLKSIIEGVADPPSKRESGGYFAPIGEVNGVLVITATWTQHRRIAWLLDSLRACVTAPVKPTGRPVGEGRAVVVYAPEYDGAVAEELRVYDVSAVEGRGLSGEDLGKLIGSIELGSWNENGGTAWSRQFGRQLLIRQSPAVHSKIAALLDELRKRGLQTSGSTSPAAPTPAAPASPPVVEPLQLERD